TPIPPIPKTRSTRYFPARTSPIATGTLPGGKLSEFDIGHALPDAYHDSTAAEAHPSSARTHGLPWWALAQRARPPGTCQPPSATICAAFGLVVTRPGSPSSHTT